MSPKPLWPQKEPSVPWQGVFHTQGKTSGDKRAEPQGHRSCQNTRFDHSEVILAPPCTPDQFGLKFNTLLALESGKFTALTMPFAFPIENAGLGWPCPWHLGHLTCERCQTCLKAEEEP